MESGSEIIYCSYSLIDRCGNKISDYTVPEQTSYCEMLKESVLSCSTTLLAKSVVDKNRFSSDYYHEDLAYWLQLLKSGYSATACCESLAGYRILEGSRSHSKIQSAKNRWVIYRKAESLSWLKSISVFLAYVVRGLRKYRGVWYESIVSVRRVCKREWGFSHQPQTAKICTIRCFLRKRKKENTTPFAHWLHRRIARRLYMFPAQDARFSSQKNWRAMAFRQNLSTGKWTLMRKSQIKKRL